MAEFDPKEIRYHLEIQDKYYNQLDIEGFSLMLKDPSYCYKFYWLEAIVQLIAENKTEATYDEIINEMIVNAWYPVLEYHVHLSGVFGEGIIKDNLEKSVLKLHELCELPNNASKVEIKNQIAVYDEKLHTEKMELTKNVPYKALSGFANKGEEKISLDSSAGRMMSYYNRLSETSTLLPYTYGQESGLQRKLTFAKEWMQMIRDNTVVIMGWIQYEKVKWLQNNNPEIPGLVYKISPNEEKVRKLDNVRKLWEGILESEKVIDVFKEESIVRGAYDVEKPQLRKRYEACYRDNLHSIWASTELYKQGNSETEFYRILEKNMRPVYDSARRQGYQVW